MPVAGGFYPSFANSFTLCLIGLLLLKLCWSGIMLTGKHSIPAANHDFSCLSPSPCGGKSKPGGIASQGEFAPVVTFLKPNRL